MAGEIVKKTFGETFLLDLQNAGSRGLLFAVLEKAAAKICPQNDLEKQLAKVSDFASVAAYQDKLARIRIEYNARTVRDIHQRLIGLANFGEDNYKYKEKMIRKLNLLIHNHPTIDDLIYITMTAYISRSFGNAEDFKNQLKEHIRDNRAPTQNGTACAEVRTDACSA